MKKTFLSLIIFNVVMSLFAASSDLEPINDYVQSETGSLKKYSVEAQRLKNLAKQAFDAGEYDLSLKYSEAAIESALLSDRHVARILIIDEANYKLSLARSRIGWADNAGAARYFKKEFYDAKEYYNIAFNAQLNNRWNDTIINAEKVTAVLAAVVAPPENSSSNTRDKNAPLPAQYIVRPWDTFGDCFWNIAGKSWAYGDPHRWPILYQANKKKIPDPKNPDLIEPGMIMDIPSLNGEIRADIWDSGKKYSPIK